ncbi:YceI family protein [uncultured Tateyamaria sp.]|uniref:YceI family protein n=1 Tax=uncultured Tateyamaria sp. TaxID=455651 RepID=UPI002626EC11|nr:YceI family protein [uncultured Tateyamaria sp.]
MKSLLLAAALATSASFAFAADKYTVDSSHAQVLFSYNHFGFSTTWGMFSGFEGEISFDQENPANSTVNVSMPTKSMFTGWEQREAHFMSEDFFGATDEDVITFTSTAVEVTGEDTAKITGDLTMNDVTKSVVLDATLNQVGPNPVSQKDWAGFDATTTLLRSDFGLGAFAPAVSDEVQVQISVEAEKAE